MNKSKLTNEIEYQYSDTNMFYNVKMTSDIVLFSALAIGLSVSAMTASAFDELKPAQKLVYEKSHLANTNANQKLHYSFDISGTAVEPVTDKVTVNVGKEVDAERRDVAMDFLSEDRQITFPDFEAYRGNPVIIATLEYSAQLVGRESGGGTLYFRNRIRDAMAQDLEVKETKFELNDETFNSDSISFEPFKKDANLAPMSLPQFERLVYTITISDDIVGGVVQISMQSKDDNGDVLASYVLTFESSQ